MSPLINQDLIENILWHTAACVLVHASTPFLSLHSDSKTQTAMPVFVCLGEIWLTSLSSQCAPGSPLAVALGCGEIILGSAEWSRHQTHREEWITPTGRDSNKLQGGGGTLAQIRAQEKEQGYRRDKTGEEEESSIEVVSRKWEMRI